MLALVQGAEDALAVAEGELPDDFPARTWERISEGVRHHRQRFMREAGQ
jgi:serine/threonine-protein kinase HipA